MSSRSRWLTLEDLPSYAPPAGGTVAGAIQRDYLQFLAAVAAHCGDMGTYLRDGQPVVLVNSPGLARELLIDRSSDVTKGDLQRTAFRALLGETVSLSEGERHRQLRRLLATLLTRRQTARYAGQIASQAAGFCTTWPDTGPVDLFTELHRLTLHTLGRTLIAEDSLWDEQGQFWQDRQLLWGWMTGLAGQGQSLASKTAAITDDDVSAKIAASQNVIDHVIARRIQGDSPQVDLLADLLAANQRAGCPLSLTEVRDQILALLFAGHETSACVLFWSLYLLAGHPCAQRRLEHEADTVLAGQALTAASLSALPWTLQVVKEALRLYPPAGRQFRVTARPIMLGGCRVPEGTPVTMCQYLLHRGDEWFPEPESFDPSRFAPAAPPHDPMAYVPFGAGERICLGRHYALQETQILLAYLAGHFRFTFPGPVTARLSITVRPRDHAQVQVTRRRAG